MTPVAAAPQLLIAYRPTKTFYCKVAFKMHLADALKSEFQAKLPSFILGLDEFMEIGSTQSSQKEQTERKYGTFSRYVLN